MAINATIEDVTRVQGFTPANEAIGRTLLGINHRRMIDAVPVNREENGYIFFTRPMLNMSEGNLKAKSVFTPLLSTDANSIQRILRKTLDPRLINLPGPRGFNNQQAFVPFLSNLCVSATGFPDPSMDFYTTAPGMYREQHTVADGVVDLRGTRNISLTFRSAHSDPVNRFIWYILNYMEGVKTSEMVPYPDMIANREIDYDFRVYRLVMDQSRQFVQKIACTGRSMFANNSLGDSFNFDHSRAFPTAGNEASVSLVNDGFYYDNPVIVHWFNMTVAICKPEMFVPKIVQGNYETGEYAGMKLTAPELLLYKNGMVKIPVHELDIFNGEGYPRINPRDMRLDWWIEVDIYRARKKGVDRTYAALTQQDQQDGQD